jgi:hypothetical protein
MPLSSKYMPLAARTFPFVLVATLGCDVIDPGYCTTSIEPAIVVEIRDSRTGAPLAGLARGVVREGTIYVDSLKPGDFSDANNVQGTMVSRVGAYERAGVYDVEVERDGYQRWTASSIRVGRGECHVETATVQANLVPTS